MAVKAKSGNYAVHHTGYMAYQVIDQRDGTVCGNFRNLSESFGYAMRLSQLEKQEDNQ
jgi:hypothetical protein